MLLLHMYSKKNYCNTELQKKKQKKNKKCLNVLMSTKFKSKKGIIDSMIQKGINDSKFNSKFVDCKWTLPSRHLHVQI